MVTPAAGSVVLVRFPFSDLTQAKLRPAIVLADAGRADWILCQVTSNPYGDSNAVALRQADFQRGSLQRRSFARPGKLFTAHESLMVSSIGTLRKTALERIIAATVEILQP